MKNINTKDSRILGFKDSSAFFNNLRCKGFDGYGRLDPLTPYDSANSFGDDPYLINTIAFRRQNLNTTTSCCQYFKRGKQFPT